MNYRNAILIVGIGIALSIALWFMIPRVSGIEISQGDPVYLGETVDISRAIAWPDFTVAWCDHYASDCVPPDQVIEITNHMYTYYIDPAIFHTGTYYRWDGHWNRGENMVAFNVRSGTRPVNVTNTSVSEGEKDVVIKPKEGPFTFVIARGDTPLLTEYYDRTDTAHLWIFAPTIYTYDLPMMKDGPSYTYQLSYNETFTMPVGRYDGYIQFEGLNNMQDVFINRKDQCLDTPYDDAVIPDVDIELWNMVNMPSNFKALTETIPNFDDVLVPITFNIVEPMITITNVEQDEDKLFISGVTSWSNGTYITLKLDPDNYKLPEDVMLHTWSTVARGDLSTQRTFSSALNLKREELKIGDHEIKMKATSNNFDVEATYDFKISDVYVMPTPTPQLTRKIVDTNWQPIATVSTVQTTPEPTTLPMETITVRPIPIKFDKNYSSNQTQNATAQPIAKETIPTIPLDIIIPSLSLGGAVWLRKQNGM